LTQTFPLLPNCNRFQQSKVPKLNNTENLIWGQFKYLAGNEQR